MIPYYKAPAGGKSIGQRGCANFAGGVYANSGLRARLNAECQKRGYSFYVPPLELCGDNAAMVGAQAYYEFRAGNTAGLDLNAAATMSIA